MDFLFRTIQAVSGFVLGIFGVQTPVEEVELIVVEAPYEVSATTTIPFAQDIVPTVSQEPVSSTTTVPIPLPTKPNVSVTAPPQLISASSSPVVPTQVTVVSIPVSQSQGSLSSAQPVRLSIDAGSLKKVTEKDQIQLKALLTMSDGSTKDISTEASWEVMGPIGSIRGEVFTAALDPSIAEFGHGPGAITARFVDPFSRKEFTADTGVFEVSAFIPAAGVTSGQ